MSDPQGFATIPRWLLYREDVGKHAKLAYLVISAHVNARGEAWPGLRLIARKGSMSVSSAQRGLDELELLGVVERRPQTRKNGGRTVNVYALAAVTLPDEPTGPDL